ncbi:MAG: hypothetical protein KDD14_21945 [Saprospiraceae bacterium]|nr:hypothetical protein [Saprospiraceae bacterium]
MKKIVFLVVAYCVCLSSLFAQASLQPSARVLEAMEKLRLLDGSWKGSGWLQMGPQRHEFHQTEAISFHANGTVVTIDGRGVNAKDSTEVIHQAFAVVSYDQQAEKYLIRAIRADGNHVDADFEVQSDGSIVWGFSHPMAGRIRYTIKADSDSWFEIGEMSRDGETWMKFLEIKLKKQ